MQILLYWTWYFEEEMSFRCKNQQRCETDLRLHADDTMPFLFSTP